MSRSASSPSPGSRWRRRSRALLLTGGSIFLLLVLGLILFRPRLSPYTPGTEAAGSEEITRTLQRNLPSDLPSIRFADTAEQAGIRFRHFHGERSTQLPEDMGSGAAWGDYDGDGDPDLFLVNESGALKASDEEIAGSPAASSLYRNDGNGIFTDVTEVARLAVRGWGMGAAWGDYDGDADLDLVVTRFGTNLLYRNDGNGTFSNRSAAAGIGKEEGFWTGVSWSDYDRDGDLDLYVCGYVRYHFDERETGKSSLQYRAVVPSTLNPSSYSPERNLLLRNDAGVFREVGREAGVDNPTGRSLSASWADFDGDGWPDLYVANDISDNALFRNLGNGRFQDVSHSAWVADYRGAMGLGIGDWENDGDLDIFITHWIAQENALYENQKGTIRATSSEPLHFVDQADMVGLGQIALDFIGWGTDFFDYDNDGRLDLFVVNGSTFQHEEDSSRLVPMRNQLFWNGGKQRGFFEVGEASGDAFGLENVGRGAAFADYDLDGDADVAVVVNGGLARLLRNDGGNAQGWLRVILRGSSLPSRAGSRKGELATTTFAQGALVRITTGSLSQIREVGGGSSYLSQSPPGEVRFGVGAAPRIDVLEITWPDGAKQTLHDLPARSTVTLVEGGEPVIQRSPAEPASRSEDPPKTAVVRFWQLFHEATSLRMKREFAAAVRSYEEALALDPLHEDSLYYLGQCRRETGQFSAARDAYSRLVSVNPTAARGHLALADLLASPEESAPFDLSEAEAHLRRAHEINAEETAPLVRLGEILIVRGERSEAREWLEAAVRTNPKSVEAAFLAGYLHWEAGNREAARGFYLKAIRAGRTDAPVKGVLSEGGRKAAPAAGGARVAAPPLQAPMGKTLFGAFTSHLRGGGSPSEDVSAVELDRVYVPVRDFAAALARRSSRPSPQAQARPGG